jgi:hypothetical protein
MSKCEKENMLKKVTHRFIDMIILEMNNDEMKNTIRTKLLNPLLSMIYVEVYPYVYGIFITMFLILLFSLLTFILFLLSFFPKKSKIDIRL